MNRLALAIASLSGLAVVQSAAAAPVVFENTSPGFELQFNPFCVNTVPQLGKPFYLDITQPPNAQMLSNDTFNNCASYPPFAAGISRIQNGSPTQPTSYSVTAAPSGVAYSAPFLSQITSFPTTPTLVSPPRVFQSNEPIGPDADWTPDTANRFIFINGSNFNMSVPFAAGVGSWGFRITIDGQTHYGFTTYRLRSNLSWALLAWGYESTPNTPIFPVVPACAKGDVDGDRDVDTNDLAVLLGAFGRTGLQFASSDLDGNGIVGTQDLTTLLGNYGCQQ